MMTPLAAPAAIAPFVAYATGVLQVAIERATERRGRAFDPMRSLYVSDLDAFEILKAGGGAEALSAFDEPPTCALPAPLRELSRFECATIALLAGIAVIPRVDRVVGFLHDDLTRRGITTGLLLDLFAHGLRERERAIEALRPDGLLVRLSFLIIIPDEHPSGARVQLDGGALARLLGSPSLDPRLRMHATRMRAAAATIEGTEAVSKAPTILWGADAAALADAAAGIAAELARPLLRLSAEAPVELVPLAAREALFDGALLSVATVSPNAALQAGRLLMNLPIHTLVEAPAGITALDGFAHRRISATPRAVQEPSAAQPLPYGRRIIARRGLDALVLPSAKLRMLGTIAARLEHRETVTRTWGLQTGSSAGGIRCLFSGPPGTGKTLAAEAIATRLGRDLYVVDVSMVVSKFIGETEKLLSQVFGEAARANVCLFFDEADAIFGKRGEQKDAHDRYANIETAYLLQAIDAYPDLVVLATNMRNNIDDALTRRIDVFVDFVMPDPAARRRLWTLALARAPHHPADVDRVAERFALSGGSIQNAALSAAYEAASQSRTIVLLDLLRAARDELAKSGRVAGRFELGDAYTALLSEDAL